MPGCESCATALLLIFTVTLIAELVQIFYASWLEVMRIAVAAALAGVARIIRIVACDETDTPEHTPADRSRAPAAGERR
jgi:hypothetical protein